MMHLEFGYMLESRQRFVNLTLRCHLALCLNKKHLFFFFAKYIGL
jgi:hypothetical protein